MGVFATKNIEIGELVESCPYLKFSKKDRVYIDQTDLYNYYFVKPGKNDNPLLALGFGSIYNHSSSANLSVAIDKARITFTAVKMIRAGDELFINYNGDPNSKKKPFFEC